MSYFRFSSVFLILFGAVFQLSAQTTRRPAIIKELTSNPTGSSKIQIIGDKKIENLLAKYIENNSRKSTITGYKLKIFSNVVREKANSAKAKFLNNFSDIKTEIDYIAPDWVVYVGKFRNRTDAFRLKKQIEYLFPNAFIVEQQVEYKELN
jgi:hypothetical protein